MPESLGTKIVRRLRQFASDLRSGKPLKVRRVRRVRRSWGPDAYDSFIKRSRLKDSERE
jgi:hypothetical protein